MSLFEQLKAPLLIVLFTLILLFLSFRLFGPIPFTVHNITTTKTDFFTVDGTGEVAATATKANFSVGVTKTAATEADAKNQMNEITNKVIADLRALGIKNVDIKTTNFSVYPNNPTEILPLAQPANGFPVKPTQTGFTATQNIDVTANSIDLANKALDTATADGANIVSGVNFVLDNKTQEQLTDQAREKAIANAKMKAQKLASVVGIHLGRIVNITESSGGRPISYGMMKADSAQTQSPPTNLQPGKNKVSVTVTLSYETL